MIRNFMLSLLPPNSIRRQVVKKITHFLGYRPSSNTYYNSLYFQGREFIPTLDYDTKECSGGPLISIVVPAFNTPERYLMPLVYSVISQVYTNWELVFINASTDEASRQRIRDCSILHNKIKVIDVENAGISKNTNIGIKNAKGDYIALVDHDDLLDEAALYEVAKIITRLPDSSLIYSDEDKVSDDGSKYFDPHFKPDWSPVLMERVNYINHFCVIRKSLIDKVGGLDSGMDGAQDYDLFLRLIEKDPNVIHIPKVLYHWRAATTSTAHNFKSKNNITLAGEKALSQHFKRKNIRAKAKAQVDRPGFYEAIYEPYERLSIIITPFCTNALLGLYVSLLMSKSNLKKHKIEIILPKGVEVNDRFYSRADIKLISYDPKSSDALINATKLASNSTVVLINSIVLPLKRNWIKTITGYMRDPEIASVAPVVIRKNEKMIEDGGIVLRGGQYVTLLSGFTYGKHQTYFGAMDWPRNVVAQSGGIAVFRKSEWMDYIRAKKSVAINYQTILRDFSEFKLRNGMQNVVNFDAPFVRAGIYEPLINSAGLPDFFNENIIVCGQSIELAASDAVKMNILYNLNELELDNVIRSK